MKLLYKRGMNKKGSDVVISAVVYILVIILFAAIIIFFVSRAGKSAPIFEQLYAKQIALVIDKSLAGTNISLDISKLYEVAKENKYKGELLKIDNDYQTVFIKLANGKGYSYEFFNGENILWNIKENEKRLYISVIKSSGGDFSDVNK